MYVVTLKQCNNFIFLIFLTFCAGLYDNNDLCTRNYIKTITDKLKLILISLLISSILTYS